MSSFNNEKLTKIIFSILVKRLGGEVKITQQDIDDIAFNKLLEGNFEDGSLAFKLEERKPST